MQTEQNVTWYHTLRVQCGGDEEEREVRCRRIVLYLQRGVFVYPRTVQCIAILIPLRSAPFLSRFDSIHFMSPFSFLLSYLALHLARLRGTQV